MTPYSRDYYLRMRDDPEFKRKRKEYNAKRWRAASAEVKAKSGAWNKANPERMKAIGTKHRTRNLMLYIYRNIKKRAKAKGREFTIEMSDIPIPDVCPIFGVPFNLNGTIANCDFSPSIDRIDSTKGYVKGNVQVISRLANCMKWTSTPEQLIAFAKGVLAMSKKSCGN